MEVAKMAEVPEALMPIQSEAVMKGAVVVEVYLAVEAGKYCSSLSAYSNH